MSQHFQVIIMSILGRKMSYWVFTWQKILHSYREIMSHQTFNTLTTCNTNLKYRVLAEWKACKPSKFKVIETHLDRMRRFNHCQTLSQLCVCFRPLLLQSPPPPTPVSTPHQCPVTALPPQPYNTKTSQQGLTTKDSCLASFFKPLHCGTNRGLMHAAIK